MTAVVNSGRFYCDGERRALIFIINEDVISVHRQWRCYRTATMEDTQAGAGEAEAAQKQVKFRL